jgi:hypothetical protein
VEAQTTVTLSLAEFERLIRRIVREEVSRLLQSPRPSILDDWSHEGQDDPGDEEELAAAAVEAIDEHERNPGASMSWDEFDAELKRAEAAGELPGDG